MALTCCRERNGAQRVTSVGNEALVEVEVESTLAEGGAKLEEDKELGSCRHLDLAPGYGRKLPDFQSRRCREK
jgi:hypothetical protein